MFYKVEWEGYGEDDATWKSEEEVIDEGLEWMIADYEMRMYQRGDELDLGRMLVLTPLLAGNGIRRGLRV